MECAKCGKNMEYKPDVTPENVESTLNSMVDPRGFEPSIYGIEIMFTVGTSSLSYKAYLQSQMGKYEPGKTYFFCVECLLDSIFNADRNNPFGI